MSDTKPPSSDEAFKKIFPFGTSAEYSKEYSKSLIPAPRQPPGYTVLGIPEKQTMYAVQVRRPLWPLFFLFHWHTVEIFATQEEAANYSASLRRWYRVKKVLR